jgi:hypothetical protein
MRVKVIEGNAQDEGGGRDIGKCERADPHCVVSAIDDIYNRDLLRGQYLRRVRNRGKKLCHCSRRHSKAAVYKKGDGRIWGSHESVGHKSSFLWCLCVRMAASAPVKILTV